MAAGCELSLPAPPSPQLRRALPDLQAVLVGIASAFALADVELTSVEVTAPSDSETAASAPSSDRGVGAFFSGGVDSWWTLLSDPEVSDLIYVHGFDISIDDPETSATVERRLGEAARRSGRRLHVVRTDLRDLLDPVIGWEIAHGPALAAVALLFEPLCSRVLIPSTTTHAKPVPRGSHPLLDPLWSIEGCRIEHSGAHRARDEKLEQLVGHQEALDVLRVCWRHVDRYNCGRCEKCLRTMVALEALGALDRCPTFPDSIDLDAVSELRFHDPDLPLWWRQNLELARRRGAAAELIGAMEACLAANPPAPGERAESSVLSAEDQEKAAANARELEAMRSSRSWRLTRPLRDARAAARRLSRRGSDRG